MSNNRNTRRQIALALFLQVLLSLLAPMSSAVEATADTPATPAASVALTAALSPEEALKSIHVRPGFAVDLVACEPLTMDPVAVAWGADGKLWIVEMADYPSGIDGKMKPGGRIRYLESTRNDGHYDKSTLFMEGVNFPTGIIPWRKGVIVSAAPEIFYAEDTIGSGKANVRTTLYSGFREGNTQLRVNGLRWGIDGWLYCANGWSGGVIKSAKTGETVNINRLDFRIRPDEGKIELQSGQTEFGRDCDDWGDWFGCDNSNPLFHFPIDDRYLRRNPYVTPPHAKIQLEVPVNPKVFALSIPQKRYHTFEHSDHFTSACSATIYRDSLLFPTDDGLMHAFTCEPVHNLVHHELVRESGVTFTAVRADEEKESEFFASTDQWCRPVMVRTGPDGALWVVDMYRYIIEHPDWLPVQGKSDLAKYWRMGEDKGRIYRVYPKDKRPASITRLDNLSTQKLVETLGHQNFWYRDTAQQLLIWKNDPAAIAALDELIAHSASPTTRMTALCTYELLGALTPARVERGLHDRSPMVRRQAIRLSESLAGNSPALIDAAVALVDDSDAKVRLQLACTLGEWDDARAGVALAKLAEKDAADGMISGAVMSSALKHYPTIADALIAAGKPMPENVMRDLLSIALGAGDRGVLAKLVGLIDSPHDGRYSAAQMDAFHAWLDTLSRGSTLARLRDAKQDALSQRLSHLSGLFEAARRTAADASRPPDERSAAAGLLGREEGKEADDLARLATLLTPQTPGDVQLSAVKALGKTGLPSVPELLTKEWASRLPDIRNASIEVMISREPWIVELLKSVEAGKVSPRDLDLPRRQRLTTHKSPAIRTLAAKVLGEAIDLSRQKVVDSYQPALALKGDLAHGKMVFAQNCAVCHHLGGVGNEIGPNLLSVSGWAPDAMLVAILDPSRAVEPRYLSFNVILNDNEAVFGIISAESPASITLKGLDGKERTIQRSAIKSLSGTNRSLMPDGLESALSKQDLADVIRYLQSAPSGK